MWDAEGQVPPVAVPLENPRVRDLVVTPHALETYDLLEKEEETDER